MALLSINKLIITPFKSLINKPLSVLIIPFTWLNVTLCKVSITIYRGLSAWHYFILNNSFYPHSNPRGKGYYYPNFTDKKIETKRN